MNRELCTMGQENVGAQSNPRSNHLSNKPTPQSPHSHSRNPTYPRKFKKVYLATHPSNIRTEPPRIGIVSAVLESCSVLYLVPETKDYERICVAP
ncbi:hypothetical protein RSAG8_03754, partial [Rhizoctonia solani AG-8 WAC10335]